MCLMVDNESSPLKSKVDSEHLLHSTSYSSHDIYDSENELQDAYYIFYENNNILKEKFIRLNHNLENADFENIALKMN